MTSGYGSLPSACNDGPTTPGCTPPDIPNIADRLEGKNLSWKAYMEDYPVSSGCYNQFATNYFPNHNPFVYYQDIINNTSRCNRIVNANSQDDIHNCNDVSVANAWLQQLVPNILNSPLFQTRRAALFITFDEAGCSGKNQTPCPSAGPQLYTVWASNSTNPAPPTKMGFKSTQSYTHFSALRTVEDNWGFLPFIVSADGSANNMEEFFRTSS